MLAVVRNLVLGMVCVVAGPTFYHRVALFVAEDPFIGLYKRNVPGIDESIGIRMDSVELRDFKGPKLVSSAHADRIDIRKDRQAVTLYDVSKGFYANGQSPITYSAKNAVWNMQTKLVTVTGGVSVKNKDLDLKAGGLSIDDRIDKLKIQGGVTGRLFQGSVVATALVYNTRTGEAEAGPIEWQGKAEAPTPGQEDTKPKKWDIKCSQWKSLGSKTDTYLYNDLTASDEDLILVAPVGQQNKKTDILTASGGISYYSGKADLTADSCVVYRKEKRVVLSGHVFMYVKPKSQEDDPPKIEKLPEFKPVTPDQVVATNGSQPLTQDEQKAKEDELRSSKNLRDFPLVVVADRIEYWYGKGDRHAVITGKPQGRQSLKDNEWRHVWSDLAFYDGEKETLKLASKGVDKNALMKNSLGDHMKCAWITVSTKEDDDYVEGSDAAGSIYSSEDVPTDKKKADTPPVKTGQPPPVGGAGGKGTQGT